LVSNHNSYLTVPYIIKGGNTMKKKLSVFFAFVFLFCGGSAYAFDSGSTGSLGAFNPTVDTEVTLPPDGKLNYTTVNIPSGVKVTFKNLSSYNSPVYMLATGDVLIAGTIDVSGVNATTTIPGAGGPGGFDGGYAGWMMAHGGKGLGPGSGDPGLYNGWNKESAGGSGSFGGKGGNGFNNFTNGWDVESGPVYNNERLIPLIGGSGGGGSSGSDSEHGGPGGGGGGAIVIASSTSIAVTGTIIANGGTGFNGPVKCDGGSGSGGGIKLVSDTVLGNGAINAMGGAKIGYNSAGGLGRIRIESYYNYRTASTDPPYTFGAPTSVFLSDMPTLSIDTIAGTATPASPTGNYNQPDMMLPNTTTNPVTVAVSATNVPLPANVDVWVVPQYGSASSYSAALSGSDLSSSGSAGVTLSTDYSNVIVAETTFAVQQAMYIDGDKIAKIRVAASAGNKSKVVYITESGKEISGDMLAGLVK
jgi:hypothetical protein